MQYMDVSWRTLGERLENPLMCCMFEGNATRMCFDNATWERKPNYTQCLQSLMDSQQIQLHAMSAVYSQQTQLYAMSPVSDGLTANGQY